MTMQTLAGRGYKSKSRRAGPPQPQRREQS